jgi:hypothetical protein
LLEVLRLLGFSLPSVNTVPGAMSRGGGGGHEVEDETQETAMSTAIVDID